MKNLILGNPPPNSFFFYTSDAPGALRAPHTHTPATPTPPDYRIVEYVGFSLGYSTLLYTLQYSGEGELSLVE